MSKLLAQILPYDFTSQKYSVWNNVIYESDHLKFSFKPEKNIFHFFKLMNLVQACIMRTYECFRILYEYALT